MSAPATAEQKEESEGQQDNNNIMVLVSRETKGADVTQLLMSGDEKQEEREECPICCYELSISDKLYSLHCSTECCRFNYCHDCIAAMQKSVSDERQERRASGDIRRLPGEINMICPFCRGKYQSSKYQCDAIINAVLSLREAHAMQSLLEQKDSDLSATDLAHKDRFIKMRSLEELKEAIQRLEAYQRENGKDPSIPQLDLKLFQNQLEKRPDLKEESPWQHPFRDPSLFLGRLDELMTADEQVYVTELFVSGQADLVAKAALICMGCAHIQNNREQANEIRALVQKLCSDFATAPITCNRRYRPQLQHKLRKRYPLPEHMPRCVSLPVPVVPDPEGDDNSTATTTTTTTTSLFSFEKDNLSLRSVRGPVGQAGLRWGDTVTHVNGEPVHTQLEVNNAIFKSNLSMALVVVNADEKTAQSLRERYQRMKQDDFSSLTSLVSEGASMFSPFTMQARWL